MIMNKFEEWVGLAESEFHKFQSEFGLNDEIMKMILETKHDPMSGYSLKSRCVFECLRRDVEDQGDLYIIYRALVWKDKDMLLNISECNQKSAQKLYDKYSRWFKDR